AKISEDQRFEMKSCRFQVSEEIIDSDPQRGGAKRRINEVVNRACSQPGPGPHVWSPRGEGGDQQEPVQGGGIVIQRAGWDRRSRVRDLMCGRHAGRGSISMSRSKASR